MHTPKLGLREKIREAVKLTSMHGREGAKREGVPAWLADPVADGLEAAARRKDQNR